MTNKGNLLAKLETLRKELKSYKRFLYSEKELSDGQKRYRESLREKLVEKSGAIGQIIENLTRKRYIQLPMTGETTTIWAEGLGTFPSTYRESSLDLCIDATNEASGKLKSDIERGIRDEQGNVIGDTAMDIAKSPIDLFDAMQFHPEVVEASRSCFVAGNYREAILNAFISLIDYIKEISGLDLDGDDLMNNVFSFNYDKEQKKITRYPIICINELKNRTDRDEQQGFMFLCKGAAAFVRNPKAHKLIIQTNPLHTLEYLAFASMLFKQLDKRVQTPHKEKDV